MTTARNPKYRVALSEFSQICQRLGLSQTETVIVAAQFTGMAIATCQTRQAHEAQLSVAAKAMRDAYTNKVAGGRAPEFFGHT